MRRRNLLNFLLITGLFMLCPCIVCGLPLNQFSGNGSSFTQTNNPDSSQEAQRAEFMRKYGITEQQAMRIQQFSWERSCKIRELNQQNLSTKELLKKRKALTKIYYQKIAKLLTPEQYAKFNAEKEKNDALNAEMGKIIKEYNKEYAQLKKQKTENWATIQVELKRKYEQKLAAITDIETAKRRIRQAEVARKSRGNDVRQLKLSRAQNVKIGELKLEHEKRVAELTSKNLARREWKIQKGELEKLYNEQVKALLGDDKYIKWVIYNNQAQERQYITKFGFTQDQYAEFKKIENKCAVEIMRIKRSEIPYSEKQTKIQAAKDNKIKELRDFLPSDQFKKWYENYQKKEANAAAKRQVAKAN